MGPVLGPITANHSPIRPPLTAQQNPITVSLNLITVQQELIKVLLDLIVVWLQMAPEHGTVNHCPIAVNHFILLGLITVPSYQTLPNHGPHPI